MRIQHKQLGYGVVSLVVFLIQCFNPAIARLAYQEAVPSTASVLIDVRPQTRCLENSLPESMCLPVQDLLAAHNRLINFSGLYWLLGTAGLSGDEHVAIIGDSSEQTDFVAGVLLVAGQAKISVVSEPVGALIGQSDTIHPGRARASTRTTVFQATPRTDMLLLKSELLMLLNSTNSPLLLDGRSESEYWGQTIRAARGGHLPGAMHAPNIAALTLSSEYLPVVYAHDSKAGLAYLARLAARGIEAQLYLGGWAEWAQDGTLPADAQTFPAWQTSRPAVAESSDTIAANTTTATDGWPNPGSTGFFSLLGLVVLLLLVPGAYLLGRSRGATA